MENTNNGGMENTNKGNLANDDAERSMPLRNLNDNLLSNNPNRRILKF